MLGIAFLLVCQTTGRAELEFTKNTSKRARDLGIIIGQYAPGPWNAITDVGGVKVGHIT